MAALFPSSILYIRNIKLYSPQPALELDKNTPAGTMTSMKKAFFWGCTGILYHFHRHMPDINVKWYKPVS